jgi:DNA-binding XRE family transcriptional regulator
MWKTLKPVLFVLSLVLTVPSLAPAADQADRTDNPGGCVVPTVEVKGRLVLGRNHQWVLFTDRGMYFLGFDGNQGLLDLAKKLNGRTVVVIGFVKPKDPTIRVTGLKVGEYVKKTVQVEIKGQLLLDETDIYRPFGVYRSNERPGRTMSFGQHVRTLREGAGLSRPELARRASVPVSTLRNWEADRGFPGLPVLVRLAGALGVPVERLAEGVEDPAEEEAEPVRQQPRRRRRGKTS